MHRHASDPGRTGEAQTQTHSHADFVDLLTRGLAALGFTNWVFHAEIIATKQGLRFVELNPRPPGGLLSRTASVHLGVDLFEAIMRIHLGIDTEPASQCMVTGQFPIYAERIGTVVSIGGLDEAKAIPCVDRIEMPVSLPCAYSTRW
jgi:hypothetical protein